MHRLVWLFVLALGCASSDAGSRSDQLPVGNWSGEMVDQSRQTSRPAVLLVDASTVQLVVGASRVRVEDLDVETDRLRFRAAQFPISQTERRTLRCDLLPDGDRILRGTCQASAARYALILRRPTSPFSS